MAWTALWVTVGAVFGGHVEELWRYRWWALTVAVALLSAYLAFRLVRRRRAD